MFSGMRRKPRRPHRRKKAWSRAFLLAASLIVGRPHTGPKVWRRSFLHPEPVVDKTRSVLDVFECLIVLISFRIVERIIHAAYRASGGNTRSAASAAWSLSRSFQRAEGITSASSKRGWRLSARHHAIPLQPGGAFFFFAPSPRDKVHALLCVLSSFHVRNSFLSHDIFYVCATGRDLSKHLMKVLSLGDDHRS